MVAVERHRYVPRVPLDHAHDEIAVVTHRFPGGSSLSCASEPNVVAAMLDALDVRPGSRIMEIGAGTGYNAALLATLAGPDGRVTTIDINPEVTAGARRNLDATGFHHVVVLTRDGARGRSNAPYDRIIVTVGAWDLPRAWWDQLVPHGRLVVPLRWRGTSRRAGRSARTADRCRPAVVRLRWTDAGAPVGDRRRGGDRRAGRARALGAGRMTTGGVFGLVRDPTEPQRATPVELFYDLVFVFILARLAEALLTDLRPLGAYRTLLLLLAVWWIWSYTNLVTETLDSRQPVVQMLIITIMLGSLVVATAIPEAFAGRGYIFAAGYVGIHLLRSGVLAVFLRHHQLRNRPLRGIFWFGLSGVLWLAGAGLDGGARILLWTVALGMDYLLPLARWPTPRIGRSPDWEWGSTGSTWRSGTASSSSSLSARPWSSPPGPSTSTSTT